MMIEFLSNRDIIELTGLKKSGINQKGERQDWPYEKVGYKAGRDEKHYPIITLPDDIQVAWVTEILKKGSKEKIRYAKSLPIRTGYYAEGVPKRYDGKSSGICKEAAQLLSSINLEDLPDEPSPYPVLFHGRAPSRICPQCGYGEYKDENLQMAIKNEEDTQESEKGSEQQKPEQNKNEKQNDHEHCIFCGTELIDHCPVCNEAVCHPNQNFCKQGHQLRHDRAIPEYAKKG